MVLEKLSLNLAQKTSAWVNACGKTSILQTKPQKIHGVNPSVIYSQTGKSFDLPRFSSVEMNMARTMNKIAIKDEYIIRSKKVLSNSKILPEDLKRLKSTTLEDTYKHAFWINPKDYKGYHLLDEGRTKNGLQKLRILDENGVFVKNAVVKPRTVILTDLKKDVISLQIQNEFSNIDITHTDLINIFARRYNPFAKYKTVLFKDEPDIVDKEFFRKLYESIDKDTSCISASFGQSCTSNIPFKGKGKEIQNKLENNIKSIDNLDQTNKLFREIANKARFLIAAGNNGNCSINIYLLSTGLEGVGGLNSIRKVHCNSSSRNSLFTQHYENYEFPIKMTEEGINITGLYGTDIPITKTLFPGKSFGNIFGTSCATPIRAAKLALNEMMEGLL